MQEEDSVRRDYKSLYSITADMSIRRNGKNQTRWPQKETGIVNHDACPIIPKNQCSSDAQ